MMPCRRAQPSSTARGTTPHSATVNARGRIGLRGRTGPLTPPSQAQRLRVADRRGSAYLKPTGERARKLARALRLDYEQRPGASMIEALANAIVKPAESMPARRRPPGVRLGLDRRS